MEKKLNLWIFCHYAQQPPYNTMLRYHNWGKYIQNKGYHVTIVAAGTVHNTDIDVIEKIGGVQETKVDGIRYLYVKTPSYKGNGIARIRNMMSFCLGIGQFKKVKNQPDCIIECEAYLFPFVKMQYKKVPVICDIVDLWPLSIIEYTSISRRNLIIRFLYLLEKYAYIKCDALIFSMEGGAQYVKEQHYCKRVDPKKIYHINMGCDLEKFDLDLKKSEKTAERPEEFTVTYCGSMRQANHIIQICEAAKILKERGYGMIRIRFFGNGPEESVARQFCTQNQLDHVTFYGRFHKKDLPAILSESDVNIMTYMQTEVMQYGGSQSKLFDYLAIGKPIINCGKWGYDLVSRYQCGLVVEQQTADHIAEAIIALYRKPKNKLEEMGRNARSVSQKYDQPILVELLDMVVKYTLSDSKYCPPAP